MIEIKIVLDIVLDMIQMQHNKSGDHMLAMFMDNYNQEPAVSRGMALQSLGAGAQQEQDRNDGDGWIVVVNDQQHSDATQPPESTLNCMV